MSSIPSSIDSFPLSDGNDTVKGRQRLASLNPTMGRFGINLPLLGSGRGTNTSTEGTTTTISTLETSQTMVNTNSAVVKTDTLQVATTTTTASSATPVDASTTDPAGVNTEARMEQYSSWWDYVGWGAGTVTEALQPQDATEGEGDATPKPPQQPLLESSERMLPDSTLSPSPDDDTKTISPDTVPPISVSHEGQASWYHPWAWYGSTSASLLAVAPTLPPPEMNNQEKPNFTETVEPETAPVDAPSSAPAESADTTAQQRYWTSFFSYSQPSTSTPLRSSDTIGPVGQPHYTVPTPSSSTAPTPVSRLHPSTSSLSLGSNPIGDSINSNRTGWVSFFSNSGTLGYVARKAVTSGEPEVMDIDSDDATDERDTTEVIAVEALDKPKEESDGRQVKDDQQPRVKGAMPAAKPLTKPTPFKPTSSTKPVAPPLTISDSVKRQVANNPSPPVKRPSSPSPSVASKQSVASTGTKTPAKAPSIAPPRTPTPNLVLPTWGDTFHAPPRSVVPQRLLDAHGKTVGRAVMEKTMRFVSGVLFASGSPAVVKRSRSVSGTKGKGKDPADNVREKKYEEWGLGLPRAWDVMKPAAGKGYHPNNSEEAKEGDLEDVLRGCKNVVVIGIHGWFPGAVMRSVLGEPTGTSTKFVNMMVEALEQFQASYNVSLEKITRIPLEGEGTIDRRVEKLYAALTSNADWMADIHSADVIFVATHSQGSVVSTHVLNQLIRDGHLRTGGSDVSRDPRSPDATSSNSATLPAPPPQRVCCLALCGIHLGPLRYLSSSSLVLPYIQYFESAAAHELFQFQDTESEVSKTYINALRNVLDNGIKMVYVASLNDQVVPLYSGLFTSASHPLILRALYIDGDAYHSSDFLSNLLVLLLRVLNSGLTDSGLIAHLSEATAGSLNGVGHSSAYEEISTYSLAVKYLFLSNSGFDTHPELTLEPFNANTEQNDYEIPWSLRDIIADERVAHFFSKEITQLAADFKQWHPKTTILRELKRKLQPIQRLPPSFATTNSTSSASVSKL
ncbi:hypothetical protein B0H15DRAFT_311750 [Mycena belliarum]|uniref:YMC020W-like alpha/beta hydrolase domain-containing protein n=1 Tax=Mycena belliarum TaxID=1033014 RepID=A0AAD6UHV5_9AGAR|nr:hypothetical protein B0H15DRAFT_311750 [Mycena belliae]